MLKNIKNLLKWQDMQELQKLNFDGGKVMKKIVSLMLSLVIMVGFISTTQRGAEASSTTTPHSIDIQKDANESVSCLAVNYCGSTLVKARDIAKLLDGTIDWVYDSEYGSHVVELDSNGHVLKFYPDNYLASFDGVQVNMNAPCLLINDTSYIPLRYVAGYAGYDVDYDSSTGQISIISPDWQDNAETYLEDYGVDSSDTTEDISSSDDYSSSPDVALDSPTLTSVKCTDVGSDYITVECQIVSTGGAAISDYGFSVRTQDDADAEFTHYSLGRTNSVGTFTETITGLDPDTTYYVKAYAKNSEGTQNAGKITITTDSSDNVSDSAEIASVESYGSPNFSSTDSTNEASVDINSSISTELYYVSFDSGCISSVGARVNANGNNVEYGVIIKKDGKMTLYNVGSTSENFDFEYGKIKLQSGASYVVSAYAMDSNGTLYMSSIPVTIP